MRSRVRAAYQEATTALGAQSTLGPVATAGIPIEETLGLQLGDVRRLRGQVEWTWTPRTFTVAFIDHKRFGKVTSFLTPTVSRLADTLARLPFARVRSAVRDVSQLKVASPALFEETLDVPPGSTASVAGVASWRAWREICWPQSRCTAATDDRRSA